MSELLSEEELAELEALTAAATPGPWAAHIEAEAPIGGESMIGLDGLPSDFPPDMYVRHDNETAPPRRHQVHRGSAQLCATAARRSQTPQGHS